MDVIIFIIGIAVAARVGMGINEDLIEEAYTKGYEDGRRERKAV